jgi:hypothetical protein
VTGTSALYSHPLASDNTQTFVAFDTRFIQSIALDLAVSAFTGGTTPTITFFVDRLGADGITWTQAWTSGAINAASTVYVDLGPYSLTYAAGSVTAQHFVPTGTARLRWAWGGGANPTAVTWSASVIGRG